MVKRWHYLSGIFVLLLSVPLHFLNEWTGYAPISSVLAPVNESIWEHLKLLAIPMILFTIPEYFLYGKHFPNYLPVRLLSILIGMAAITTSFYTYSGILGKNYLVLDILTLVFGILCSYLFSYRYLHTDRFISEHARFQAQAGFLILLICFALFTWNPPSLAFFQDYSTLSKQ